MDIKITCICGKKSTLRRGRSINCPNCHAFLKVDGVTPIVRIPEDTIEERKSNGSPVMLKCPVGWEVR
jgi:hypothetical protein